VKIIKICEKKRWNDFIHTSEPPVLSLFDFWESVGFIKFVVFIFDVWACTDNVFEDIESLVVNIEGSVLESLL
jgi:hypothetical protein